MSDQTVDQKSDLLPRKKRKSKRKATSPLNDTNNGVNNGVHSTQGGTRVSTQVTSRKGKPVVSATKLNKNSGKTKSTVKSNNCNKSNIDAKNAGYCFVNPSEAPPIMSFSINACSASTVIPQQPPGSVPSTMSSCTQSTPTTQTTQAPQQQMYNMPPPHPPPQPLASRSQNWVADLINDVKHIKLSMNKLDQIERTVNTINMKVSDLELKVNSIEPRVTEVEKSCSFISYENDNRKREVESARAEVQKLKSDCSNMQADTNFLRARNATLEAKVTDLESRSMRDNLLFYGIREQGQLENCEQMVKEVCIENLDLPEAIDMKFDRVHRVGTFSYNRVRPIVA